ncbi:MAG TPA: asparagine synthase (glutamine-hydrolyzing) [Pedobacter sp.]|nr:asparagine synthase (glutamine-hydrolyzing) [Pedobacter sp.]
MCGIFGTINYKVALTDQNIFEGLWHRGPDQQSQQEMNNVKFYHTRLAIQDLSIQGMQPKEYHGLTIVFNGEIYNHMELRAKYGLSASSNSDTLTILMLFELLGMKMLEEFDGMFAFALYDAHNRRVYLARDRAGKKPLYVYAREGGYVFSSELNILYQAVHPEIDYDSLSDYLYLGHHYKNATPYLLVDELENGNYLSIDTLTGRSEKTTWFKIEDHFRTNIDLDYEDSMECVDGMINDSVKRRIDSSDLDVGSFLSGGIDSGLVTAIGAGHTNRIKTFTVKMEGAFDESGLAQQVVDHYNTDHKVVNIDFSGLQHDVEKILINYGEPVSDNSVIPSYYVAKEAKKHITVVLNGDGADELFGGYRRYVPFRHIDFFHRGRLAKASSRILTNVLPVAVSKQSTYTYLYRLLKFSGYSDIIKMYCSASSDLFVGFEDQFLVKPLMKKLTKDLEKINEYPISSLKKLLLMDFDSMLFGRLLPKMDIATMAHSLEGRSPFLSKELLEFAPALSDDHKIKGVRTKVMLRDLAKKYLPEDLINQPKRGFEVPLAKWIDTELKEIINFYLLAPDALYPSILKRKFIEDLISGKIRVSSECRAKMLFCVFGLEVWYRNL